jgi:hypothetical protein
MLSTLLLTSFLAAAGQAPGDTAAPSYTPEQLAVGTIRSILSAQALYKQTHPGVGYACDIETSHARSTGTWPRASRRESLPRSRVQ